jgi:hypothetical protein
LDDVLEYVVREHDRAAPRRFAFQTLDDVSLAEVGASGKVPAAGHQQRTLARGEDLSRDNSGEVLVTLTERRLHGTDTVLRIEWRIAEKHARPFRAASKPDRADGLEELCIDRGLEGPAEPAADPLAPNPAKLAWCDVFSGEVAVDERLMESVSKLDDDGINRLGEPLVDKQRPDQAVLLVEPMRLAERDHRRGLEERQYAVMGCDRNRLKTGVVAHGVVVAAERKSTPWAR